MSNSPKPLAAFDPTGLSLPPPMFSLAPTLSSVSPVHHVVVVPARTDALLDKLCALGAVVDLELLPGAGHDNAAVRASEGSIVPWLAARFAGEAAPSVCAGGAAP